MKTQHDHYDRLSVRLSVIISRLLAGQSLELKALANEFGVSERTLQRDFQQRLIHLDLEHSNGCYRLIRRTGREHLPKEGANKQVISSQADSLIKISRIWADFFPANTSNQPI